MLTPEHASIVAELARHGAANGSTRSDTAIMLKVWEAIRSFEAWAKAELGGAAPANVTASPTANPEGPQG